MHLHLLQRFIPVLVAFAIIVPGAIGIAVVGVDSGGAQSSTREVHLLPGQAAEVDCPTVLSATNVSQQAMRLMCQVGQLTATATQAVIVTVPLSLTATRTLVATATRTLIPTAPPSMTATTAPVTMTTAPSMTTTMTSTATQAPAGTSVPPGVPLCAHNPNSWHPLYDASQNCHYNHEHHDDPNTVNDLFGPPNTWWGGTTGQLQFPWYATTPAGNPEGHEGYKWLVKRNLGCNPTRAGVPQNDGCITAYRTLVHVNATAGAANIRFHGFSLEAMVSQQGNPSVAGMVRHGGHLDTGHLALKDASGATQCPLIGTNPTPFTCGQNNRRHHSGTNFPNGAGGFNQGFANWYNSHNVSQVDVHFEEFGPIDFQSPSTQLFFGPGANDSRARVENMAVTTRDSWLQGFKNAQGLINFDGYTNRAGSANTTVTCTAPSVDCVPLEITNALSLFAGLRGDLSNHGIEYDTTPAGTPSWIVIPN